MMSKDFLMFLEGVLKILRKILKTRNYMFSTYFDMCFEDHLRYILKIF